MKFGTMEGLACMYKGPWNKCDRTVQRWQKKFLPEKVTKFWNSKISEFLKWIPDLPPQKMVHLRWRWPEKNQLQLIDQNFLNCGWNIFFEKFAPPSPRNGASHSHEIRYDGGPGGHIHDSARKLWSNDRYLKKINFSGKQDEILKLEKNRILN